MLSWTEKILIKRKISPKSNQSILKTPWSEIHAFETDAVLYYLKTTPPELFIEVKVLKKLASSFADPVPQLIASNSSLNCFITKDAGIPLRKYLHDNSNFKYLYEALDNFLKLQRQIKNSVEDYLAFGVPDWRLNKLPELFNTMLLDEELLSKEGLNSIKIKDLKELSTSLKSEFEALALFAIPETLVQLDFHSNNILIDSKVKN